MTQDSLGDRMKLYENSFRQVLPKRLPIILRLDGIAWHNLTKGLVRPIDLNLVNALNQTAKFLCENIQGVQLAYLQSDEISLLITNNKTHDTQPAFGNSLNKLVSASASMAGAYFTSLSHTVFQQTKIVTFDSRVFVVPEDDVCNAFLWRQNDASRNSISSLAQTMYSHKELHGKNSSQQQELIWQKGTNWNDLPTFQKRGRCIVRKPEKKIIKRKDESIEIERTAWVVDNEIPIFSQDRNYIEKYLQKDET